MSYITMPEKKVDLAIQADVVVVGAGLAGISAAVAAARSGLNTVLVEATGKPGGVPTSALLGVISGFDTDKERCVAGFPLELQQRVIEAGGGGIKPHILDPEILNMVLLDILNENGIKTLFHTQFISANAVNNLIEAIFTFSKSGIQAIKAKLFIDDTGDADIAAALGCPFEKGRNSDGLCQSATLVIKIGGIDSSIAPPTGEITKIWKQENYDVPINHAVVSYINHTGSDSEATINMIHINNFDATNVEDLTRARFEGAKQAKELINFFRECVPVFKNAYISQTASQVGIRETRRIVGDYQLVKEDLITGKDFNDMIARGCWPIDIHSPDGIHTGIGEHLNQSYGIPYRCILPQGIDNLYVVGRAISADHIAASSTRINSTCGALGQAAGCAAKMAITAKSTRKVNVDLLQKELLMQGAIIERQLKN